ncbi:R3H-associated N-terminal domain-containing protein [Aspergillus pseudoustus]|uniref:R3H-associated N-terminal domain-containing protein n=1 Tax=Aspergillus pseudoustus TaxID=1810923 RepID=A0ABR4J970_9EURO
MAIHPSFPSQADVRGNLSPQQAQAISAWTEQATASLENLTVTQPASAGGRTASVPASATVRGTIRGSSISLSIPLDDPTPVAGSDVNSRVKVLRQVPEETPKTPTVSFRSREPLRRDSLKRREALLKGKDGSRRRQRWENDRLLHNPWATPPSSKDWSPQPTHIRHEPMPYYLAPLWDKHYAHLDRRTSKQMAIEEKAERHHIPKELRLKLKHARAARGMLQDIEEDIRQFIQRWNERQALRRKDGLADAPSSSDDDSEDEIVFVGRNGQMHDSPGRKEKLQTMRDTMTSHKESHGEKMVYESLVDDRAAGFGRWLVHSIATYYGLHTWSVTVGSPARREAYVGFHPPSPGVRGGFLSHPPVSCRTEAPIQPGEELPRPLWSQV